METISPSTKLSQLRIARWEAAQHYTAHLNPGGLTAAELDAWGLEEKALELRLLAAQLRVEAEQELLGLLQMEAVDG